MLLEPTRVPSFAPKQPDTEFVTNPRATKAIPSSKDGFGLHTLYRLSVEKKGHFICTGSCTQLWHPLHPRHGKAPTGVSHLSVLTRPDHTKQIAYRGHPLYTFAQDTMKGDVKGQGFKDVGTWSVIKVGSTTTQMNTTTNTNTGGGYGY